MSTSIGHLEQLLKALDLFGLWSNYLLVTTVAALGWVAAKDHPQFSSNARRWVVGCFGASIIFAIFTLALTPLVAESIKSETKSIYDVVVRFDLIYVIGPSMPLSLKWVCWPQHVFFLVGIFVYTVANVRANIANGAA